MNTVQKKLTMFKKDDSPSHQKNRFSDAGNGVGLPLDI